jgi:predicted kinase
VHLVCGSTGAGKTTYARTLTERIQGVRFSIDEWMSTLFWMDSPQPLDASWSMERVNRCLEQMWLVAKQVASRGIPCVLDVGFGDPSSRKHFYRLAADAGLSAQLHWLDVPAEERWRRVEIRNREGRATNQLPFDVTREMFDFVEVMWKAPTDEEMKAHNGIRIT